jgi:pSer/pThr/pTyr-binding forkhead associated (FHA) protein
VFDKLLNKNKKAENIGNSMGREASNGQLKEVAYITFVDHNGGFSEPIGQKLTIGSEIGELIIEDESVSARHCTFIKNQNVICLIDHSSIKGTFLNKKKLDSGRTFIINANDKIKIGNLKAVLEYLEVPGEEEVVDEQPAEEGQTAEDELTADNFEVEGQELNEVPDLGLGIEIPQQAGDGTSVTGLIKQLDKSELKRKAVERGVVLEEEDDEELSKYFDDSNSIHELDLNDIDVEEVELDPNVLPSEDEKNIKAKKSDIGKRSSRKVGQKSPSKKSKQKVTNNVSVDPAANIIFRFFAIALDSLFCIIIINIFHVFLDFQNFYKDGPVVIKEIFNGPYNDFLKIHVDKFLTSVPELNSFVNDILGYEHFSKVTSFVFLLVLFRFMTTLIFSVSLGQALVGIRAYGNSTYKRILGGLRELVGVITIPFIFFDLPAFFGKRSFKEIVTKTHTYNENNLISLILSVFFVTSLSIAACLSPIIKGLEVLPGIQVEEVTLKTKPWVYKNKVHSKLLDLQYDLSGHLTTLPSFQINQKNKKRYLTLGLLFLDKETGKSLDIKKIKEFSMFSVYKDFVRLNLLSEHFYPVINGVVNDVSINNDNFKTVKINKLGLIVETKRVIESIFTFNLSKTYDFVIENGPIVSGHRDFREKIENLVQDKIKRISFTPFGRREGVLMSHLVGKKDFYSFLPLGSVDGQLFILSEDITNPGLKLISEQIKFGLDDDIQGIDPIAEFAHGFKLDSSFENLELSQAVYARYHELSQIFLKSRNDKTIFKIQRNIRNLIEVLKENKMKNVKLLLNLSELLEALKKRDDEFFNIKRTTTV